MKLEVPQIKDTVFLKNLFSAISDNLIELKNESGKWPDKILFSGALGREIMQIVLEKNWDLDKFGPHHEGVANKIVFYYSKPIDQIEERGGTIFDEKINGKTVTGFPGPETLHKIISTYAAPSFTIQRQVRPSREIFLVKKP